MRRLARFLVWVLVFSAPLWLAAVFIDATAILPVQLPLSALQFLSVLVAALLVTRLARGSIRALLARAWDGGRIPRLPWRIGIWLLMPGVVSLAYAPALWSGARAPAPPTPLAALPALLLVYALSALCEELGWTAIMTDELLGAGHTPTAAGVWTGLVWAVWHLIPFIQTGHAPAWVLWQSAFSIVFRVLMTQVYVRTGQSLFATIVLHATYNIAFSMLPSFGSGYDPALTLLVVLAPTVALMGWPRKAPRPQQVDTPTRSGIHRLHRFRR
jgi:hypothetical protein